MAVDQDSHTDTIVDIYVDHIPAVIVESGFPQYGKVCLIFHQNRNAKCFFQHAAQIRIGKRVIGGKKNLVFSDDSVYAHRDSQDFSVFLFIFFQHFLYDAGQERKKLFFRQKRIFVHMAVFSFQIRDQGQNLPGTHIYSQGIPILLVKLQKDRLPPQRGLGAADFQDQILEKQILDNGGNGSFGQFQMLREVRP